MIKNYFKVAIRNLLHHKIYSIINISGLAIGLAACMLIITYVEYELSFDRFHVNADNIYRVHMKQPGNVYQGTDLFDVSPAPLAEALKEDFPEVLSSARITIRRPILKYQEKMFNDDVVCFADPDFFKIFSFQLITGNPDEILNEPFSMVITENAAKKYFGDENPIGKTLLYSQAYDFTIRGIIKNTPNNSHIKFDFLASFSTISEQQGEERMKNWFNNSYKTYFLMQPDFNPDDLQNKLPEFTQKYKPDTKHEFLIMPITRIHLHSNMNFEIERNSSMRYIYFFISIAFFIMLIACFNYMNLATARSVNRAREIGYRKVVGASRYSLFKQFLSESILLTFIAAILALTCVLLILPSFSIFIERELEQFIFSGTVLLSFLGLALIIGFISGIYPAIYLASFQPAKILKGDLNIKGGNAQKGLGFRNTLVVIQFLITALLLISSITIISQLKYIKNKDLGFSKENIVTVSMNDELRENIEPFKNKLLTNPLITDLSVSGNLPSAINSNSYGWWEGKDEEAEHDFLISKAVVDTNFFSFYNIDIISGRNFSGSFKTDHETAYIINETAAKKIGWDDPLGKRISYSSKGREGIVVGVIKDFHYYPLKLAIEPLAIKLIPKNPEWWDLRYLSLKITDTDIENSLKFIESTCKEFAPNYPVSYSFLNERIDKMYRNEHRLGKIINYFTIMAIFLACLGLFGMASFVVQQKTKEIGVRKVLGSSISAITLLLSKRFTIWVVISNILAWPIAWYVMKLWLQNFEYKILLSWWIFMLAAVIVLTIALFTISLQTMKAATKNPVDALRHE